MVWFMPTLAIGYGYEPYDRADRSAGSVGKMQFVRNVSMVDVSDGLFNAYQLSGTRRIEVVGSPDGGNRSDLKYTINEKDQGIGFFLPLGGAAFGLDSIFTTREVATEIDILRRPISEKLSDRYYRMHFLVDLTSDTQAGFTYRYSYLEYQVMGNFFLDEEDYTDYLGTMSGYCMSFFSKLGKGGVGAHYSPPMRGKSEIEGEQKILTSEGTTGINFLFPPTDKITFSLTGTRWFYKKEDRGKLSTSPIDQRRISLNGLDLEQRFLNTERLALDILFNYTKQAAILIGAYRQTGVWLFDGDSVPGDNLGAESKLSYLGYRVGGRYDAKKFFIELSLIRANRSQDYFVDRNPEGAWFGHGTYGDYSASDQFTHIGLGGTF